MRTLHATTGIAALFFLGLPAATGAAEPGAPQTAPAPVKREIIPGSELMTPQERERYRQRIRAARTPEEEAKIRAEHYRQMQERARLRGLRLPDPQEGSAK